MPTIIAKNAETKTKHPKASFASKLDEWDFQLTMRARCNSTNTHGAGDAK